MRKKPKNISQKEHEHWHGTKKTEWRGKNYDKPHSIRKNIDWLEEGIKINFEKVDKKLKTYNKDSNNVKNFNLNHTRNPNLKPNLHSTLAHPIIPSHSRFPNPNPTPHPNPHPIPAHRTTPTHPITPNPNHNSSYLPSNPKPTTNYSAIPNSVTSTTTTLNAHPSIAGISPEKNTCTLLNMATPRKEITDFPSEKLIRWVIDLEFSEEVMAKRNEICEQRELLCDIARSNTQFPHSMTRENSDWMQRRMNSEDKWEILKDTLARFISSNTYCPKHDLTLEELASWELIAQKEIHNSGNEQLNKAVNSFFTGMKQQITSHNPDQSVHQNADMMRTNKHSTDRSNNFPEKLSRNYSQNYRANDNHSGSWMSDRWDHQPNSVGTILQNRDDDWNSYHPWSTQRHSGNYDRQWSWSSRWKGQWNKVWNEECTDNQWNADEKTERGHTPTEKSFGEQPEAQFDRQGKSSCTDLTKCSDNQEELHL